MKALRTLALVSLAVLGSADPGLASIQGQMYCWAFDLELPVPCEAEEEEEAAARRNGAALSPP
jgi:hypothetical protein